MRITCKNILWERVRFTAQATISLFTLLFSCELCASELDVPKACAATGLQQVRLVPGDRSANLKSIRSLRPNSQQMGGYIAKIYSHTISDKPSDLEALATEGNSKYIPDSKEKSVFIRFSTRNERLKHPDEYVANLIASAKELSGSLSAALTAYLSPPNHSFSTSIIRIPKNESEFSRHSSDYVEGTSKKGGHTRELIVPVNSSNPVPYVLTLLDYEIVTAMNEKILSDSGLFVEAVALDEQMKTYVNLATMHPAIMCNWLYVSDRYGGIVVPLGWTMASMEYEMRSGQMLDSRAKGLSNKRANPLLGSNMRIRPDLRKGINDLQLRYVH